MISLAELGRLYDTNRFLEAYRKTTEFWKPSTRFEDLSLDELIWGGRLASRLGGLRLSRKLFRSALEREPSNPRAHYYSSHIRWREARLFDELKAWESNPELSGADPETQSNWLAWQSVVWASLRDFRQAHRCLDRSEERRVGKECRL